MDYCHIEFAPPDKGTLTRTAEVFGVIKNMKSGYAEVDESLITGLLTPKEISYFWQPTPAELAKWNDHWNSTPVAIRILPQMALPPWDLESMYEAIWSGEYELVGVVKEEDKYFLAFNPQAYPYGGIGCLVAFLECFGNKVCGYDDCTGYAQYKVEPRWEP